MSGIRGTRRWEDTVEAVLLCTSKGLFLHVFLYFRVDGHVSVSSYEANFRVCVAFSACWEMQLSLSFKVPIWQQVAIRNLKNMSPRRPRATPLANGRAQGAFVVHTTNRPHPTSPSPGLCKCICHEERRHGTGIAVSYDFIVVQTSWCRGRNAGDAIDKATSAIRSRQLVQFRAAVLVDRCGMPRIPHRAAANPSRWPPLLPPPIFRRLLRVAQQQIELGLLYRGRPRLVRAAGAHLTDEHEAPRHSTAVAEGPFALRRGAVVVAFARRGAEVQPAPIPQSHASRPVRAGPLDAEPLPANVAHAAARRRAPLSWKRTWLMR